MDAGLIYGCLTPHPPILVPEVAGHRAAQVRQTRDAVQQVARDLRGLAPDALVVVSPHAPIDPGSMNLFAAERYSGGFDVFGAPEVKVSADGAAELAAAIQTECRTYGVPLMRIGRPGAVQHLDHGAAVPLHFFLGAGLLSRLVLASFCALEVEVHRRFGRAIAAAARAAGMRVALVASGDMSHRLIPGAPAGYHPRGREFDEAILSALRRRDHEAVLRIDEDLLFAAGECGYRPLVIALGALPEAEIEVLSYEGPFGVGYLVARFLVQPPVQAATDTAVGGLEPAGAMDDHREALRLARLAVESHVRLGKAVDLPVGAKGMLAEKAGVFVSLKMAGQLRGCIGTFRPAEPNVAVEILRNAVASATRDPRFPPVRAEELPYLQYSVDVLSEPEAVRGASELDPSRYGVIVQAGARRGLLLPDLEGVSTVEEQVEIARRKAGIPSGATVQLYRFTVRRIREP